MRNKRSLLMMGLALVLASGSVFVAARWINAQATVNTSKVAVAVADISLGARLSPDMVRMVDWPSGAVPPGAILEAKLLDSRVARASIQRGEPVMEGKLAPPGTQGGLSAVVADGKRAMTVRVNDVVGVAGFALPGNFVDILVNTQEDKIKTIKDLAISKIVLERILVLAIAQESSRDETKPKVVNAVTLELTPDQAEKLDLARSVGTLSLVLRNQIDPQPVNTGGATKDTLLGMKADAVPKAVVQHAAVQRATVQRARVEYTPLPRVKVELIRGLERSIRHF